MESISDQFLVMWSWLLMIPCLSLAGMITWRSTMGTLRMPTCWGSTAATSPPHPSSHLDPRSTSSSCRTTLTRGRAFRYDMKSSKQVKESRLLLLVLFSTEAENSHSCSFWSWCDVFFQHHKLILWSQDKEASFRQSAQKQKCSPISDGCFLMWQLQLLFCLSVI